MKLASRAILTACSLLWVLPALAQERALTQEPRQPESPPTQEKAACEQVRARLLWLDDKAPDEVYVPRLKMLTAADRDHAAECLKSTSAEDRGLAWELIANVALSIAVERDEAYKALVARYNALVTDYTNLVAGVRKYVQEAAQARSESGWDSFLRGMLQGSQPRKQLHCTTRQQGLASYTDCQEY